MALGQLHIHVGKSKLEKKKSKPWSPQEPLSCLLVLGRVRLQMASSISWGGLLRPSV